MRGSSLMISRGEKMGKNDSPKIPYNVYETDCYFENK